MARKSLSFLPAILILLISSNGLALDQIPLPEGWRLPTERELGQDWRKDSKSRFALVSGDFDGNGTVDCARELVDTTSNNYGLFVSMSQNDGSFVHVLLDKEEIAWLEVMGIGRVEPGKYVTVCGKGYFDCEKGEPTEIAIEHDSIDYFKEGSANSFFYWDADSSAFKRIWISD